MHIGLFEKTVGGVKLLTVPQFEAAGGVGHCFTTRIGGVSTGDKSTLNMGIRRGDSPDAVRENIRRVCRALGADEKRFLITKQVHKDRILKVDFSDCGDVLAEPLYGECDGLCTDRENLAIMSYSADCVPLLFYDPVVRAVATAHAGWRGTVEHMGAKAVLKMQQEFGSKKENILCAIGPSIGPCHFETDEDVPLKVKESFKNADALIKKGENGKYFVDLWRANYLSLIDCGVKDDNITLASMCTVCHSDLFFSCRVQKEKMGNMGAVILLTN